MSSYLNDEYKNLIEISQYPIGWYLPIAAIELVNYYNKKDFEGKSFTKSLTNIIVEYGRIEELENELESLKEKVLNQEKIIDANKKKIEKLKLDNEDLALKLLRVPDLSELLEEEKQSRSSKIEPNIYKEHLKYRVEIKVNGVKRKGSFNTLQEAKAFKEKCISEKNNQPIVLNSDDDLSDLSWLNEDENPFSA